MEVTVRGFTVLFDPCCPMCRWLRRWLADQAQLVPLTFVPAGTAEMKARFPELDMKRTVEEFHVVDDRGALYVGEPAYIAVLWALAAHRDTSYLLSQGPLRGLARKMLTTLSKYRPRDGFSSECRSGTCDA